MTTEMFPFEIIFIMSIVPSGVLSVYSFIKVGELKNILTQKISYLNEELKYLDEKSLKDYSLGKHKKFRMEFAYVDLYPPKVVEKNLVNKDYSKILKRYKMRINRLNQVFKVSLLTLPVIGFLDLVVFLVVKYL